MGKTSEQILSDIRSIKAETAPRNITAPRIGETLEEMHLYSKDMSSKIETLPDPSDQNYKGKITISDLLLLSNLIEDNDLYLVYSAGSNEEGWSDGATFELNGSTYPDGTFVQWMGTEWRAVSSEDVNTSKMAIIDPLPDNVYVMAKTFPQTSYDHLYGKSISGMRIAEIESYQLDEESGTYKPVVEKMTGQYAGQTTRKTLVVPYSRQYSEGQPAQMVYKGGLMTDADKEKLSTLGADEEDLTSVNNKFKLKDRTAGANGMGYKILRKNTSFASQVTETNTIYEIRYNFDLEGGTVTIPSGCTLKFEGGKLSNGAIDFNNAEVQSKCKCFESTLTFSGLDCVNSEWFGIDTKSEDISSDFNSLMSSINASGSSCTVQFRQEVYRTSNTLNIQNYVNIKGNPCFFIDNATATCVCINGANRKNFEFWVRRKSPALWANNDSIGVVLENCQYCNFYIPRILYFTQGIICRASNGKGFAWNEIYIDEIYSALQSFIIESKTNGWPNANNVHGGLGCNYNSGTYNKNGATLPWRGIVLKSDGQYGANGWSFDGLWLEAHSEQFPENPTYMIDFCDYVNGKGMAGCTFNNVRIELSACSLIKINTNTCSGIRLYYTLSMISGDAVSRAIDQNGDKIYRTSIYNNVPDYDYTTVIELDNGIQSIREQALNSKSPYLIRGGKFIGVGSYGKLSTRIGSFGYDNYAFCVTNFDNKEFFLTYTGRCNLYLFDENFNNLNPDDQSNQIEITKINFRTVHAGDSYGYSLADQNINSGGENRRIRFGNLGKAKYMAIGFIGNAGYKISVRYVQIAGSTRTKLIKPFGDYGDDVYVSETALNSIRAQFNAGDKYYHTSSKVLYEMMSNGSIGSIGSISVTGTAGNKFVTASSVTNLLVGDYVKFSGTDYVIRGIDSENGIISLDSSLTDDVDSVTLALIAPTYNSLSSDVTPLDKIKEPIKDLGIVGASKTKHLLLCKKALKSCFIGDVFFKFTSSSASLEPATGKFKINLVTYYSSGSVAGGIEAEFNSRRDKTFFRETASGFYVEIGTLTYNSEEYWSLKIKLGTYFVGNISAFIEYSTIVNNILVDESDITNYTAYSTFNTWGTTQQRPNLPSSLYAGFTYYDTTLNKPITYKGIVDGVQTWIDADGFNADLKRRGTTANRPLLSADERGFEYFDTTLNQPIWWDGTAWVNATDVEQTLLSGTKIGEVNGVALYAPTSQATTVVPTIQETEGVEIGTVNNVSLYAPASKKYKEVIFANSQYNTITVPIIVDELFKTTKTVVIKLTNQRSTGAQFPGNIQLYDPDNWLDNIDNAAGLNFILICENREARKVENGAITASSVGDIWHSPTTGVVLNIYVASSNFDSIGTLKWTVTFDATNAPYLAEEFSVLKTTTGNSTYLTAELRKTYTTDILQYL